MWRALGTRNSLSLKSAAVAARLLFVGLFVLILVLPARGQDRFEIQPYVGYKWGGSTDVGPNVDLITKINFNSSVAYGITGTFNATPHLGFEFLWNRQPSTAVGKLPGGLSFPQSTSVNIDQFQGNFVFTFREREARLRPFALVGLGATDISGKNAGVTKFSFALGGGVKYFVSEHVGIRLQIRYAPTYLYSTSAGVWCDWYGFCFSVPNDHYLNQGDVTGGLILRF
jgi:opacity protein-like surface antigen